MGLTIAVAGLNFGQWWVPLYQLHPDVDRVVLCDASAETLQRVGTSTGIADRVQRLDDVLADPRIDAVHLLTPLDLPAEQTMAALRAGIESGSFADVTFGRGEHHQDIEGWPGYWVGLPPMWYSIHALAALLAILGVRPATVRALGSGRLQADRAAKCSNPYPLETALYEREDSSVSVEITRSMFQTTPSRILRRTSRGPCLKSSGRP
jgi:hypothetical protein